MRAELGPLPAGQLSVDLSRDRSLRLGAAERPLELLAERAAGPEDQRLDRRLGEAEQLGDLPVGTALQLAQRQRRALREAELGQRAPDLARAEPVVSVVRAEIVSEGDLARSPGRVAEALAAHVVGDRDQPGQ